LSPAALSLLILVSGCGKNKEPATTPSSPLEIKGTAFQDIYESFGSDYASPVQYSVHLEVTNTGRTALQFDTIEGVFLPENGAPLAETTRPYDETKGEDPQAYAGSDLKADSLEPGKPRDFDFETDGYTDNLLLATGKAPLRFGLTMTIKKQIVFGPVVADLPSLQGLPERLNKEQGATLRFYNPDPKKSYEATGAWPRR